MLTVSLPFIPSIVWIFGDAGLRCFNRRDQEIKMVGKIRGGHHAGRLQALREFALKENPDMDALMYLSYFFRSNQEFQ